MKHFIITLLCIVLVLKFSVAQDTKEKLQDRHFIGGSFGLQFGSIVNINVSPHYGYYFTKKFSVGIGGTYQYYKNSFYTPPFTFNIYGGSTFLRYDIIEEVFVHAEYELLYYETDIFNQMRQFEKIYAEGLLGGIGYRQFMNSSNMNNLYIMLLYNLNETKYTPYSNPVLRIGIEFFL